MLEVMLEGPRARGAFLLRSLLDPPWSLRIEDEAALALVFVTRGERVAGHRCGGAAPPAHRRPRDRAGPGSLHRVRRPGDAAQHRHRPGRRLLEHGGRQPARRGVGARRPHLGTGRPRRHRAADRHLRARRRDRPAAAGRPARRRGARAGGRGPRRCPTCWRRRRRSTRPVSGPCSTGCWTSYSSLRCGRGSPSRAEEAPGWFRAQGDPVVGTVLGLLEAAPEHAWTVAGAGGPGRRQPGRARSPLHRAARPAAHRLPDAASAAARRRPAPGVRRNPARDRPPGRLRQPLRVERGVQAGVRSEPAGLPGPAWSGPSPIWAVAPAGASAGNGSGPRACRRGRGTRSGRSGSVSPIWSPASELGNERAEKAPDTPIWFPNEKAHTSRAALGALS